MVQWINTWLLICNRPKINSTKSTSAVYGLLSFNSSVDPPLAPPPNKKRLYFFTGEAAECKSGSVIFHTTLGELSGLPLRPDVYIFLWHPLPPSPLRLMNFQSVSPTISTLLLSHPLPRSCSFSIIYGLLAVPLPGLRLRVGISGGMGVDGRCARFFFFFFSSKLKYSCMCARVAV